MSAESTMLIKAQDNATPVLKKVQQELTGLKGSLDNLGKKAMSIGAVSLAGFGVGQYVKDATVAAARYETLGIVMEQAGKNAGYTAQEMSVFQKSLVQSGISMTESRETMSRLAAANIDLAKSSQLARTAQDLAVVGGINSSDAFQRMTQGIVSAEVEVLRTIGLNVNFEESYKKLAAQLGKNTDSLTAQEKMQARVNIVIDEGAKFAGIYAASMETAGKKLTSLPRYFQDISVMAGQAGLEVFGSALDSVTDKAKAVREELERMSNAGELDAIGKDIGASFKVGIGYIDEFAVGLGAYAVAQKAVAAATALSTAANQNYAAQIVMGDAVVLGSANAERMKAQTLLQTAQAEQAAAAAAAQAAVSNQASAQAQMQRSVSTRQYNVALLALQEANHTATVAQERLRVSTIGLSAAQAKAAETSALAAAGSKALSASMATGGAAIGGLKGAASSLITLMGGPWVAGLTAASVGMYALWSSGKETRDTMESLRQQFLATGEGANGLAEGLDKADATMLRIMRSAAEMKLDKAKEQLETARKEVEKFTKSMSLDESTSGFSVGKIDEALEASLKIMRDYKDGIIDAAVAFDRIKEARDKYGRDNKVLSEAEGILQSTATAVQNVADKEKSLGKVNESFEKMNGNVKMTKEQADALAASMEKWVEIETLIKSTATKGIPQDIKQAIAYSEKLIESSNYGAESQKRIGTEAQNATRALFAQAIEAAKVAEELAFAAGNYREYFTMGERVTGLSKLAQDFEKGVSSGVKKSGGSADSARASLVALREEIERLAGRGSDAEVAITKKANEIEKLGKSANLSAPEIANLKQEFNAAFATDALQKFDDELLKISGNTSAIQAAEMARDIEKWTLQLNALVDAGQLSQEAAAQRLAEYKVSLEKQVEFKDVQTAVSFIKELNDLSGDYNMGKEESLRLLDLEAEMYRQKLPAAMHGYIGEWKELKRLQNSRDAMDGLERGFRKYTDEATNAAKETERIAYDMSRGMEDSLTDMVMNVGGKSKSIMDSLRGMFSNLLSDLFRMAIARPITLSIVGSVSGALGGNGTAQAQAQAGAGGAGGDLASLAGQVPWGSMMPNGMTGGITSGITNGINSAANWLMPGTFAPNAGAAAMNTGYSAGEAILINGMGGNVSIGATGPTQTFSSSLGQVVNPWSIGGGIIGGIGASMITPELFKGANPQAVSTGTSIGSGVGGALGTAGMAIAVANGWNPIGWAMAGISLLSTLFGGVAGGGLGALFGGEVHKPGLWAGASLDLAKGYSGSEMEESSKDRKHPWQWYTHKQDDGYLVQARHRHGMSKEAAEQATKYLEDVSKQALGMSDTLMTGMSAINADLGAAYKSSLNNNRWTNVAQDWEDDEPDLEGLGKKLLENTRDKLFASLMGTDMSSLMKADDGAIADTADEIVGTVMDAISVLAIGSAFEGKQAEYVNKMGKKLAEGYGSTGIDISDYLSVDLNNLSTGMVESLAAAVTAINSMQAGVKQLQSPLSAVEQQAEAAKKQLDEYAKALEKSGLNQKWAAGIIEDYRKAMVDDYIKKLNESIHPASTLSTTMKNVNDSVTQTITAMKMMAATSEELAQIESQRAAILERAYENTTREYNQDYATRHATVTGGDKDSVSAIIARENELRSIEEKYGKGVDYTLTLAQKSAALNADKYQGKTDWTIDSVKKAIADAGLTVAGWFESFGRKEGFSGPDYTKVLIDKAASLNADKYQGKTDWTVESVKQAIAAGGMNVGSWYEMYGKDEGFAASTDFYAQTEALQKAEEAKRALDALQAQQNKYLQEQVNLSQKLVNSWQGVVDALNDTRAALHRENTDPARGFAAAQAEFDDLYAKALGGDSDAAAKMGQIGSELLAMGKKNSADQYIYQQLFNDIDKKLFDTGIYAEKEYDSAQVQLDLMNKQLGVQETTKDLTAEILKAQNALNAALAGLAAPKPEYKPDAPAMGSDAWKRSVLTAKAAALNAEKYEGKTNWTVSSVEKYMNNTGVTFEEWYKMYGKAEGFATGGVTPANTPFWVGERGPELMMTSQQYGVLSHADSLNMLARVSATSYADDYAAPYATGFTSSRMVTAPTDMAMLTRMPAAASDGGATAALHAAISELRDEVKTLRQDNKTLLGQVAKHTKDSADEAAHIRNTGMPTREYTPPPMHVIPFPE